MEHTILTDGKANDKMFVEKIHLKSEESASFSNNNDYFYYTISGYGLLNIESYSYNLEQETSIFIPKESEYTFTNTGETDLVLVRFGVK